MLPVAVAVAVVTARVTVATIAVVLAPLPVRTVRCGTVGDLTLR